MPYLLNVLYVILVILASPMLAYRAWRQGKYRSGWSAKLRGEVPRLGESPRIWFHAVSVGEVLLLRPLIADLRRRRPDWDIVVSSTTSTGLDVARIEYPDLVTFYAPLDFSWAVKRAIRRIRPTVLALVELELWPNLVRAAHEAGARVAIVNGRLSEHSFKGYRKLRWALRGTMEQLDLVAAQSEEYAGRFIALGTRPECTCVTGSVKYDGLESDRGNNGTLALRRALGISALDVVLVGGSTMEGEEAAVLAAYREARKYHPRLRLVLVPRHRERFEAVASWLVQQGESVIRRSQCNAVGQSLEPRAIVLVDTMGELSSVWGLADIAFVGGSLFRGRGGQNMMEPAAFGASVIFGQHTQNFRDAVEGLLACGGARRVETPRHLAGALISDLDDPESAHARGAAGRAFVLSQQGAAARTLIELEGLVSNNTHSATLVARQ